MTILYEKFYRMDIYLNDGEESRCTFKKVRKNITVDNGLLKFTSLDEGKEQVNTFILNNIISFHLVDNEEEIDQKKKTMTYDQLKKMKDEVELSMGGGYMEIVDWEDIEKFFKKEMNDEQEKIK